MSVREFISRELWTAKAKLRGRALWDERKKTKRLSIKIEKLTTEIMELQKQLEVVKKTPI